MAVWNPAANEVFLQAAQIASSNERKDFLESACGDDAILRAEVESLLSANDAAAGFLESPPELLRPDEFSTSPTEISGSMVGRYKLLEPIGEGGFGVVYRAEQLRPLRRMVALKIIKPGMDTRQVVARFEAERQALALMQHANIAQVLDGGTTPSGRPYFVMELVDGTPITEYCDRHRLGTTARLNLFLDVCKAVHHAHVKGIIHRDLKPSNVLVTEDGGKPLVKVIDFGVAKAIHQPVDEQRKLTLDVQMVGTPLYMSPEQTEFGGVDVDTRSDVYSLGVVLYELLTGMTPFEKQRMQRSALDDVRRIVREEDPPAPSVRLNTLEGSLLTTVSERRGTEPARLGRALRGELDWIVMKALEKDRSRRYQTVADFAADIERSQRHEPVSASPPSTIYRLGKFARRHQVSLTAGAIVLVAILAGGGFSLWQAIRATNAQNAEIAARRQAEENFRQARASVDRYFTLVSESELLDIPGLQPLRKDLLDAAREYYEKFRAQRSDDPELQAELAVSCIRLAQVNNALDANEDALAALRQGLDVVSEFKRSGADPAILRRRLAGVYRGGHMLHRGTRQPADPASAFVTIQETVALWDEMVHDEPENALLQNDLAGINLFLGDLLRGLRMSDRALPPLRKATSLWEILSRENPDVAEYRSNLARCESFLSDVYRRLKRADESHEAFQKSLALSEQLTSQFPDVREYRLEFAIRLTDSGKRIASAQEHGKAREAFEKSKTLLVQLTKSSPGVPVYRESLANNRYEMARLLRSNGEMTQAQAAFRDAIADLARLVEIYPQLPRYREQLAAYARQFALFLLDENHLVEAETMYRLALTHAERLAADFPDLPLHERTFARYLVLSPLPQLRNPERALSSAERAVKLSPTNPNFWNTLGVAQYRAGRSAEAVTSLQTAVTLRGDASIADGFALALAHVQAGDMTKAREWYDRADARLKQHPTHGPDTLRLRSESAASLKIEISSSDQKSTPPSPFTPEEAEQ